MHCHNCGHQNLEENRFCGMCGNLLTPKTGSEPEAGIERHEHVVEKVPVNLQWRPVSAAGEKPPAAPPETEMERAELLETAPAAERSPRNGKWWVDENESTVGGPSFLGLSKSDTGGNGGYSYLFQDEPPRSHKSAWVLLVLLAVLGGLVYAKWQPVRDYVLTTAISHSWTKAAAARQTDNQQSPIPPSSAPTTTLATTDPQAPPTIVTEKTTTTPARGRSRVLPRRERKSRPPPESPAMRQPGQKHPVRRPHRIRRQAVRLPRRKAPRRPPARRQFRPGIRRRKIQRKKNRLKKLKKKTRWQARAANKKPSADRTARVEPVVNEGSELVNSGEKYLYGHGVARSCNQAVTYFQAAAAKQNPQAFSHLGALYATGECVPMDRAVAYAWFRRAYAKEPSNHYFEQNLTMLWREMTPDERQRATRSR